MRKFISLLILFCALSCSKTEHSYFPSYPVYLELDLTFEDKDLNGVICLLYTSPSPRDAHESRMPSSA